MGGGLDMGRFGIKQRREPSLGSDAATKGYIDRSIVPLASTVAELSNNVVKLDGKSVMTGNLDLGRNSIKNVREPALGSDAWTKGYVDRSVNTLTTEVTDLKRFNLQYNGAQLNINMLDHKLINLVDPEHPQDSATKAYVDNSLFADRLIGSYETISVTSGTKIRLISNPGNTIKVVAEITTADSINGHYIIKATQLVSAVSGEVTPTERYNIRRLDIIPILKYKTGQVSNEVYHIIIHMFLATDPELTVEFRFYNEALNIQRISIKIYKSYA
jgi:hypothetical protein